MTTFQLLCLIKLNVKRVSNMYINYEQVNIVQKFR